VFTLIGALAWLLDFSLVKKLIAGRFGSGIGSIADWKMEDARKWLENLFGAGVVSAPIVMLKAYGTLNLKPSELMATLAEERQACGFQRPARFS